ncbi:Death ligand signal enhancer [Portunus trituberculatus]|uniref:Death ligand signal enhancer n=1 Tax=Portunus trituberculatus TaxID=210409 RepID=A0A5B7CXT4_PORTR|nr:Death ligand signal enhancer [Portunus trituberculatus]
MERNLAVISHPSCIRMERLPTEASETELSAEEKDGSEYCQSTSHNEPINNLDSDEIKMLQEKLLEIVKAHHKEHLSEILKKGNTSLDSKPEEMIVYFQAGVLVGDSTSAFNLALCYHMGHGTTQDLEKARKLYEVASAAGHGWATYNLAVMLNHGLGGPFLPQKAYSLLLQAATMGVKEAKEALSGLEEEEDPQQTVSQEGHEPSLRQCYSEPCLHSLLNKEWPLSYSTGDLHSLLDEDDWTAGDTSTVANVSQIT